MSRAWRFSFFSGMRAVTVAALLLSLAACSGYSEQRTGSGGQESLQGNLSIASAALAAGQPNVARRLYQSLAERYEDAPDPVLGLGYIALQTNDHDTAHDHFVRAAKLAEDDPARKAEALLGAGRTALAKGKTQTARKYLSAARKLVKDPSTAAWIENGLAVAAVLDGDFGTAEAHYTAALRHSSAHPRTTANYLRMLIASGRVEEARRIYGEYDPSFWPDGDGRALQRLIDEASTQQPQQSSFGRLEPRLLLRWPAIEPLPALSSGDAEPAIRFTLAGSLSLALRLDSEPGMALPPPDESDAFQGQGEDRSPDAVGRKRSPLTSASAAPAAPQSVAATGTSATATAPDPAPATDTAHSDYLGNFVGSEGGGATVRETRELNGWSVLLGRSRQWRLDAAAEAVAAASPEIADVQLLAPDVLYVIGKKVGSTSVSVLSRNGVVQKRDVTVELDVEPLRALLARDPELLGVRVQGVARANLLSARRAK